MYVRRSCAIVTAWFNFSPVHSMMLSLYCFGCFLLSLVLWTVLAITYLATGILAFNRQAQIMIVSFCCTVSKNITDCFAMSGNKKTAQSVCKMLIFLESDVISIHIVQKDDTDCNISSTSSSKNCRTGNVKPGMFNIIQLPANAMISSHL